MLEYEKYHDYVKIIGCGDKSSQNFVIPDTIDGLPVKIIGAEAFKDCKSLTNVTIPDSVTSIGAWAFHGCKSLTNITIPDSVTTIGKSAFHRCTELIEVIIKNADCEIIEERVYKRYETSGEGATICNRYKYSYKDVDDAWFGLCEDEHGYGCFDGVIIGHKDSTAQAYAKSCGYRFKAIEDEET